MLYSAYRGLLRGPRFPGRGRIENALRRAMRPPTAEVSGGLRMALDPQEWLQVQLLAGQEQEPLTVALMQRLLEPGDTCIDVGSHVGFHALTAARAVGPAGQVLTVDPQPYNADKVLTNCGLNNLENLLVVVAAAGRRPGSVVLHNQKPSDKARLTLINAGVGDVGARFVVPVVTLDDLAADHALERVKLIKIDVEGYEAEVLGGAASLLTRTDHVIFECLADTAPAVVREIVDTLDRAGFTLRCIDGEPWTPGAEAPEVNVWASR